MSNADQIIALLTEIRDLLTPPAVAEEPTECQHPDEARVNLSTFGDRNHWICGVCRYDNKAVHDMN